MALDHLLSIHFGSSAPLVALLAVTLGLLFVGLIGSGFARLGFSWWQASLVLLASLAGSAVNLPVGTVGSRVPELITRSDRFPAHRLASLAVESHSTIVAVNVGGAVIPVAVCLYLALRFPKSVPLALLATGAVAVVVHLFAQPVAGVGIVTPILVPPLVTVVATVLLTGAFAGGARDRLVCAYMSGTLGTLIGGDLLNLGRVGSLGANVVSIGGAGTFDAVFLTGLLAVLLMLERPVSRSGADNPADGDRQDRDAGQSLAFLP